VQVNIFWVSPPGSLTIWIPGWWCKAHLVDSLPTLITRKELQLRQRSHFLPLVATRAFAFTSASYHSHIHINYWVYPVQELFNIPFDSANLGRLINKLYPKSSTLPGFYLSFFYLPSSKRRADKYWLPDTFQTTWKKNTWVGWRRIKFWACAGVWFSAPLLQS
jgi:hypothetical protein